MVNYKIGLVLGDLSEWKALCDFLTACAEFSVMWIWENESSLEDHRKKPDVILLEKQKGEDPTAIIGTVKENFKDSELILLVDQCESNIIFNSIYAGVSSIILKNASLSTVKQSILTSATGGSYLSPAIAKVIVEYFNGMRTGKISDFLPTP